VRVTGLAVLVGAVVALGPGSHAATTTQAGDVPGTTFTCSTIRTPPRWIPRTRQLEARDEDFPRVDARVCDHAL